MPSSVIRSFDYYPAERRLEVRFVSGRRYRYFEVPADLAAEMRASLSKGEFFNARIRGRFAFEELAVDA
jgi:lysyl-tRNA synthetase class 2